MKPRTKRVIEKEIKRNERFLTEVIDTSLSQEKRCAQEIEDQEEHLKKLRAEPCFEDTLVGKIEAEEKRVFDQIIASLDKLSSVVGSNYAKRFRLAVKELRTQELRDREES